MIIMVLIIDFSHSAIAERWNQVMNGARPFGMGEAFTAVVDDVNALIWNPAGLPFLRQNQIQVMLTDLFGLGIKNNYIGLALPLSEKLTLGMDWSHIGYDDHELGFNRDHLHFSGGINIRSGLALGASLRWMSTGYSLDGRSIRKGSAWGLDIGVLYQLNQRTKLGLMIQDISQTRYRYDNNTSETIAQPSFRGGIAYNITKNNLLVCDIDDRFHLGSETWIKNILALRGGIQKDIDTGEQSVWSLGFSLRYEFARLDYSWTIEPELPSTHRIAAVVDFSLSPSEIKIREALIEPIFPSLIRRYHSNELARLNLYNKKLKTPIEVTTHIYIPGYMALPEEEKEVIPPNSSSRIILRASLDSKLLLLEKNISAQAQIEISYTSRGRIRKEKKTVPIFIYKAGNIDWSKGTQQAAAWIDPDEPTIEAFAREIIRRYHNQRVISDNLTIDQACLIFSSFRAQGLIYNPDPNTPFNQLRKDKICIDHIRYPASMLKIRVGDCDDLTILYCSLLENLGIETALLETPGHIFMMFNSGIHQNVQERLGIDPRYYLIRNRNIWIPVEVTLLDSSFIAAWFRGIEEYRDFSRSGELKITETHQAWGEYEPVSPAYPDESFQIPDSSIILPLLASNSLRYRVQAEQYLEKELLAPLQINPDDMDLRIALANHYIQHGGYEEAEIQYKIILKQDSLNLTALNNLGIIDYVHQNFQRAAEWFAQFLLYAENNDDQQGGYLNLSLCQLRLSQIDKARQTLQKANLSPERLKAFSLKYGIQQTWFTETQPQRSRGEENPLEQFYFNRHQNP